MADMARPLRIEQAGGWYHVTARGHERKPIFRDDRDREHFLQIIAEMVLRFRVRLHCFVLMGNEAMDLMRRSAVSRMFQSSISGALLLIGPLNRLAVEARSPMSCDSSFPFHRGAQW
jgi:hypothetical protein